jgi:solute:Na+ symporter, SSS family
MHWGIALCVLIAVLYTLTGGMWAVSITDFVQTVFIVVGILALAWELSAQAGGVSAVLAAQPEGFFNMVPQEHSLKHWAEYLAAWITLGLGSIPGQDVFQRVNSAKDERTAVRSSYLGAFMYLTVGLVPLFIGLCAKQLHPEMLDGSNQELLPQMCLKYSSPLVQVLFFGALLSAILSTTSGAILAPATVLGENIIKPLWKGITDKQLLLIMRLSVALMAVISMLLAFQGDSIFEMVGTSSVLSLVSLFVPLMAGLYWRPANNLGALLSMVLGMTGWAIAEYAVDTGYPSLFSGLAASLLGMALGVLMGKGKANASPVPTPIS